MGCLNEYPWKRGDGHFMMTISVPIILNPIVKDLRAEQKLSRTISEFLWMRFGSSDPEAEEEEMNILLKEKLALEAKIKEFEEDSISRRENKDRTERLNEISDNIDKYRRIRNTVKHNPNGKWQFNRGFGLQKQELEMAKEIISVYGSEVGFIDEFDSWIEEKERLTLEIGQKLRKKKR